MRAFWGPLAAAALACSARCCTEPWRLMPPTATSTCRTPPSIASSYPTSQSVTIQVNATLGDIVVGDEKIADAQPMTDRTLYVIGKSAGTTTVNLFSEDKRSLGVIQVEVGVDVSDMAQAIRQVAPKSRIEIGSVNGKVRLGGRVKDGATLAAIMEVAQQYGPDAIINSVDRRRQPAGEPGSAHIGSQAQCRPRPRRFDQEHQRKRYDARRNWHRRPSTRTMWCWDRETCVTGLLSNTNPFAALITRVIDSNINVDLIIEALEAKGVVRTLAEPNLTTLSGETGQLQRRRRSAYPQHRHRRRGHRSSSSNSASICCSRRSCSTTARSI